jgi:hypothetical protein
VLASRTSDFSIYAFVGVNLLAALITLRAFRGI